MTAIRPLLLTLLFIVSCCALSKTAHAQYLVLSSSIVHDPATRDVVGYSRTEMDYLTAGWYTAHVGGNIYRGSDTAPVVSVENYANGNFAAVAETRYASAPNTSYQLYSYHNVLPLSTYMCGGSRNDVYRYGFNTYPHGYLGSSVTVLGQTGGTICYYGWAYLGYTVKGVTTPPPTLSLTNPHFSGNLSGLTAKALIGADVELKAEASYNGGTYAWSVPDQFHQTVNLSADKKTIKLRWTETGTYRATVTYTQNNNSTSTYVDVTVIIPKLTVFQGSEDPDEINKDRECSGLPPGTSHTVGCDVTGDDGTVWTATAQIPPGPYLTFRGDSGIKFKQAINIYRKWILEGNHQCLTHRANTDEAAFASGWQLDTSESYNHPGRPERFFTNSLTLTMSDWDAPGHLLAGTFADGTPFSRDVYYIHNVFKVYVFYFTGSPGEPIFQRAIGFENSSLPYAHLLWTFHAQASFNWGVNLLKYQRDFTAMTVGPLQGAPTNTVEDMSSNVANANTVVPCPGTSVTTNRIDYSEFFVKQHYFDFLQRNDPANDQGGYDFWRTQITQCGFSAGCIDAYRVAVSRAFWDSADFHNRPDIQASGLLNPPGSARPYNNSQFIRWCYKLYLNKEPDTAGWTFWLNDLNANGDYNHIIHAFLLSGDYRQRFQP